MTNIILTIHVVICIILIGVVLLQAGKGASIGATFGSGGSNTIFGGRGPATFFQKFTTALAILFMATSMVLARFAKEGTTAPSVIETESSMAAPIGNAPVDAVSSEETPEAAKSDTEEPSDAPTN